MRLQLQGFHYALLVISGIAIASVMSVNAPSAESAGRGDGRVSFPDTSAGDDRINVRDFAALGNGRRDDAPSFRRAIERVPPEGGTLYVPSGRYVIGSTLNIPRGNITIECGNNSTLVVGGPGVVLLSFHGKLKPGGQIRDVRIQGCSFFDPDPKSHVALEESHGVILNNVWRATLRDLRFDNLGDESIDIQKSSHVKVLDSHFNRGCAGVSHKSVGAASINNSSNVQLRGNTFVNNRNGSAIRIEITQPDSTADNIIIAENQILDPKDEGDFGGGHGIVAVTAQGDATGLTISNNQIVNPYRSGIIVNPSGFEVRGLIVSNNLVLGGGLAMEPPGSHRSAISLSRGASKGTVSGNVVDGWGWGGAPRPAIRIDAQRVAVAGNVVDEVPGVGIQLNDEETAGNVLVGNCLIDSAGVEAGGPNLIGLNKIDGTTDLTLPNLRNCAGIGTDGDGRLACVPDTSSGGPAPSD